MQSLNFSLSPTNQTMPLNIEASGLWYESGTSAINTRIIVSPEVGGDIELKPGQRVKMTAMSKSWRIRSLDPTATITGKILIGSGEFEDNSSLVTLDASFANNVTVMNESLPVTISGGDVEIKNDAGNPIPTAITNTPAVTISGTATVQENLVQITGGVSHTGLGQNMGSTVILNNLNTNGVTIHSAVFSYATGNAAMGMALVAKNGANPANLYDGVVIFSGYVKANDSGNFALPTKVKIPAGYGIALFNSSSGGISLTYNVSGVSFTH